MRLEHLDELVPQRGGGHRVRARDDLTVDSDAAHLLPRRADHIGPLGRKGRLYLVRNFALLQDFDELLLRVRPRGDLVALVREPGRVGRVLG